jgi:phage head maturation protease
MPLVAKPFGSEVKFSGDNGDGHIEGYASTFGNVDLGGDVVMSGAFRKSLSEDMPKMFWMHDPSEPIGRWTAAQEDRHCRYGVASNWIFSIVPVNGNAPFDW